MKEEIQKVLEMNKSGKINDDQTADLLAELLKAKQAKDSEESKQHSERPEFKIEGFIEPISALVRNVVNNAIEGLSATNSLHGIFPGEERDNTIHMSRLENPTGEEHVFRGNTVNMSSLTHLNLSHAEMIDNRIEASKLDHIQITYGKLANCRVSASSFDELEITQGEIKGTQFLSSKCSRLTVSKESSLNDMQVKACSVKDLDISVQSKWNKIVLSAASISGFETKETEVNDLEVQGVHLSEVSISKSKLNKLQMRGVRFKKSVLSDCHFNDVVFSDRETWNWKKHGFEDVRFENCDFNKVLFSECRINNTSIKNVTIADVKVQGVDFSDMTLDGNEAFLTAVSSRKK